MSSAPPQQPPDCPPRNHAPREPGSIRPDTPDQIGAWLDRLVRLTRLPPAEAVELRDELEAHLRERVHDLMLVGHDEPDAIHKSISELGDLALLAQRYRDASRTPKGRTLMHIALFAAAAAALGISTVALQQSAPQQPIPQPTNAAGTQPETDLTLTLKPTLSADGSIDITSALSQVPKLSIFSSEPNDRVLPVLAHNIEGKELGELFLSMGEAADARVYVYWNQFDEFGLGTETAIDPMPFAEQAVDKAFLILSDTLDMRDRMQLAYRLDNELMEIATVGFFDRRELELVGYDVAFLLDAESPLVQSIESDTLIELLTTLVEPGVWKDNGGYATASAVGNQLFINAPARVHARAAWLLAELGKDATHSRGDTVTTPNSSTVETRTHTVGPGETITSIAEHTLGSRRRAREIIAANPDIIGGSLEVGRVLTLPSALPASVRIEGAVQRPGSYEIPPGGDFTLARLITSAGGPAKGASRILIRHDEGEGQVIDFIDIASRSWAAETDKKLSAGDWVFVLPD